MANIIDSIKNLYNKYVGGGQPEVNQSFATPQDLAQMSFARPEDLAQMSFATPQDLNPLMSYATPEQLQSLDNNLLLQQANNQAYNNILPELNIDFSNITEATPNLSPVITPPQQTIQPFTPANLLPNVTENIPGLDYGNITEAVPNLSPVINPAPTPVEAVTIPGVDFSNITEATPNLSPVVVDKFKQPIIDNGLDTSGFFGSEQGAGTIAPINNINIPDASGVKTFGEEITDSVNAFGDFIYGTQRDIGLINKLTGGDDDSGILSSAGILGASFFSPIPGSTLYAGKKLISSIADSFTDGYLSSKSSEATDAFSSSILQDTGYEGYKQPLESRNAERGLLGLSPHTILGKNEYEAIKSEYGVDVLVKDIKQKEYIKEQEDYINKNGILFIDEINKNGLEKLSKVTDSIALNNPGNAALNQRIQSVTQGYLSQQEDFKTVSINTHRLLLASKGTEFEFEVRGYFEKTVDTQKKFSDRLPDLIELKINSNGNDLEGEFKSFILPQVQAELKLAGYPDNLIKKLNSSQLINIYLGGDIGNSPQEILRRNNTRAVFYSNLGISKERGYLTPMEVLELPSPVFAELFTVSDNLVDETVGKGIGLLGGIAGAVSTDDIKGSTKGLYRDYLQVARTNISSLANAEPAKEIRAQTNGARDYFIGFGSLQGTLIPLIVDTVAGSKIGVASRSGVISLSNNAPKAGFAIEKLLLKSGFNKGTAEIVRKGYINTNVKLGKFWNSFGSDVFGDLLLEAPLAALDPEIGSEFSRNLNAIGIGAGVLLEGAIPIGRSIKKTVVGDSAQLGNTWAELARDIGASDSGIFIESVAQIENSSERMFRAIENLPQERKDELNKFIKAQIGQGVANRALVNEAYKQGLIANTLLDSFQKGDKQAISEVDSILANKGVSQNMLSVFSELKRIVDDTKEPFYDMIGTFTQSKINAGLKTAVAIPSNESKLIGNSLLDMQVDKSMYTISARTASYFPNKPITTETVFTKNEVKDIVSKSGGAVRIVDEGVELPSHFVAVKGGYKINPLTSGEIGIKKKYIGIDDLEIGSTEKGVVDVMSNYNNAYGSEVFNIQGLIDSGSIDKLDELLSKIYC